MDWEICNRDWQFLGMWSNFQEVNDKPVRLVCLRILYRSIRLSLTIGFHKDKKRSNIMVIMYNKLNNTVRPDWNECSFSTSSSHLSAPEGNRTGCILFRNTADGKYLLYSFVYSLLQSCSYVIACSPKFFVCKRVNITNP